VIHLRNIAEKQEIYFFLKIKNNAKNGLIPGVWRKSLIYRAFSKIALTGSSPVSRSFLFCKPCFQGFFSG